jgi:hypothetical protein
MADDSAKQRPKPDPEGQARADRLHRLPFAPHLAYAAVRQDHCHLPAERANWSIVRNRAFCGQIRYAKESCGYA